MGLNYSMTGVFYNKDLAAQDRYDRGARRRWPSSKSCMAKAKAAGITPISPVECAARRASPSRCRI